MIRSTLSDPSRPSVSERSIEADPCSTKEEVSHRCGRCVGWTYQGVHRQNGFYHIYWVYIALDRVNYPSL